MPEQSFGEVGMSMPIPTDSSPGLSYSDVTGGRVTSACGVFACGVFAAAVDCCGLLPL